MPRNGLNCTMSFTGSGAGEQHSYRVRAGNLGYGVQMIATESTARVFRAYYPHRPANQQFSVQVLLKDWTERTHFVTWLHNYANWAIDQNAVRLADPFMTVSVPRRNFFERGMPIMGYEWGAHTGMMMFTPTIVFEPAFSPGQGSPSIIPSGIANEAQAFRSDPAIRYFYPFGTQLSGDQQPKDASHVRKPHATPPRPRRKFG